MYFPCLKGRSFSISQISGKVSSGEVPRFFIGVIQRASYSSSLVSSINKWAGLNSWAKKADEKKTNKETKILVIKEVFWINDYLIFISQFEQVGI